MSKVIFESNGKPCGSLELTTGGDVAKLYLYGDICGSQWDKWVSDDKCPQDVANLLDQIPPDAELEVRINSGGGSVHGAIAMYTQIRAHPGKKIAYIDGLAASAASYIPFACDEIHIMSAAQMMIHKPWSFVRGDADAMRKEADVLDVCQNSITDIYMTKAQEGVTREQITELINQETWKKGSEWTEYFNFVVDEIGEVAACVSDLFGKYKHTPEALKNSEKATSRNEDKKDDTELLKLQLELLSL